jgi:hypothetical protein
MSAPEHLFALENQEQMPELPSLILPETNIGENTFRREVFSLKELREGDAALLERIFATRMDFPLMFEPQSKFAAGFLSDPLCMRFGKNFSVVLNLYRSCWPVDGLPALAALKKELAKQGLDRERSDTRISIELMIFLRNYDTLRAYVSNHPGISEEGREEMLKKFDEMRDACRNVVEFKALTMKGIKSLEEIDASARQVKDDEEMLRFEPYVIASSGMSTRDITARLDIRNQRQFKELCLERTRELLPEGDNEDVDDLLRNIEPSDAIVLASYFARSRIQKYQKPIEQMEMVSEGEDEEFQVGDCRIFAGLATHYLNLVVKPGNPKLENWYFGIQREDIADFHHAYVKAVHVYKDEEGTEKLDLFFFDPVALSSRNLRKLREKDIRRLVDAASRDTHFFNIKRFGEDFVAQDLEDNSVKDASAKNIASPDAFFDSLLDN